MTASPPLPPMVIRLDGRTMLRLYHNGALIERELTPRYIITLIGDLAAALGEAMRAEQNACGFSSEDAGKSPACGS